MGMPCCLRDARGNGRSGATSGDELVVDTRNVENRDVRGHVMDAPTAVQPQRPLLRSSVGWDQNFHSQPPWCPR